MEAFDGLADGFQALSIDSDHLLFNPQQDKASLREKFNTIPRYLFRVSTPKSDGTTDKIWVKSKDARWVKDSRRIDFLSIQDKKEAAAILNKHLRWKGQPEDRDNLVSWTSSLLFALQYIFYRHHKDPSAFDEIYLCIIDTTAFPKGVFLRDMDLIETYKGSDEGIWVLDRSGSIPRLDLSYLKELRVKKRSGFAGSYYFGEYLSQGALKIENKCEIISAQAMLDHGLLTIQPKFDLLPTGEPEWANEVIRLREAFYQNTALQEETTKETLKAAIDIGQLFGPRWRLPIAANLLALSPRREGDGVILQAFRGDPFTDDEKNECSPSTTKIVPYETLPEVKHFDTIMRTIYRDFCTKNVETYLDVVQNRLLNCVVHSLNKDFVPKSTDTDRLVERLGMIQRTIQRLQQNLQANARA